MALTQIPIELSSTPGIVDNSNATAITIDASENVGIGVTSPSAYYAKNLVVSAGDEEGITVVSDPAHQGYLMFADGTSGSAAYRGYIGYDHGSDTMNVVSSGLMRFYSGDPSTQHMTIDSSGGVIFKGTLAAHQTNAGTAGYESNIFTLRAYGATAGTGEFRVLTGGGGGSAASEAMRIDSSGNVLIGRSSEPYSDGNNVRLHVEGPLPATDGRGQMAIATTAAYNAADRKAMLNFSGAFDTGGTPTFLAGVAGEKENTTNNIYGGALTFHTRPHGAGLAERMRIDSSGNLLVGRTGHSGYGVANFDGGIDVTTNPIYARGGGIYLGGVASANLLDDYEEGTWTVGFNGATVTPTNSSAFYTKIGRVVFYSYYSQGTTIASVSGTSEITGLPFSVKNDVNAYQPFYTAHNTFFGGSATAGVEGYPNIGQTSLRFVNRGATGNASFVAGSNLFLMIAGFYITDA